MYRCENWTVKKAECQRIDAFELWCWRRLLRVPWTARRSNQSILKRSVLSVHQKDWCWSRISNTLATWCKELSHWKRPWYWEGLKGGGEGDDRGWDGRMASLTQWTWVWVNCRSWWWTGRPGVLRSQRAKHDWATELNCNEKIMKEEWKIRTSNLTSNIDLSIMRSEQYIRITWRTLKTPQALALAQIN